MRTLVSSFLLLAVLAPGVSFAQSSGGDSEIDNIKRIIGEKTPEFIKKPIIAAVLWLEKFRKDMDAKSEGKFYNFAFASPYVFYVIVFIIFMFVLRIIWRIIFR